MSARTRLLAALVLGFLGCGNHGNNKEQHAGVTVSVTVTYGDEDRVVALDSIAPVDPGVRVSDVVQAAWPGLDRSRGT
jgi:hypothetical protein